MKNTATKRVLRLIFVDTYVQKVCMVYVCYSSVPTRWFLYPNYRIHCIHDNIGWMMPRKTMQDKNHDSLPRDGRT